MDSDQRFEDNNECRSTVSLQNADAVSEQTTRTSVRSGFEEDYEKLHKMFTGGTAWFYWIAALSLVNTVLMIAGSELSFIVGLTITIIIDSIAAELGPIAMIIAFIFDVTLAGCFIIFGIFARKGHKWAFIAGMVLYGLDTLLIVLLVLLIPISEGGSSLLFTLIFHVMALYFIYMGYGASKKLAVK
ncbi:MAG: hypothetical protein JW860_14880 [Sedimentisphaerales bacterium]|nr:hypothetical protein [Sedimentisphaerales bacterium]